MRQHTLDEIERRIIHELESNCKVSVNELGEKLGISKRMAETRMHKLIGKKAIVNFVAIVDFSKLGYVDHEVWVQIRHMNPEKKRKFLDSLVSHPQVGWVASCGGKFDYAFSVMAEDSVTFSEILRKILSDNPGIVQNYSVSIATKIRSYPRSYLLEKRGAERVGSLFFSGPPRKSKLDRKDLSILTILAKDAKTPAVEIGTKIGMSTNAARMRVKKLEAMGVIQGYKAIFQPSIIGIQNYEILITTEGITTEKEMEFDAYCRSNPHITLFMTCIGRWDILISVDIDGPQQLQQTLSEVRDRFGPVIKDFEYTPILHVYKFNLGKS
ncbi:AsnC family transcriptional regulator [Candidatus Micrarchaeota archaeon]|nr:AsnC family transcriptional regulator [Candidatus Micrarchaeota archaeon]